MTSESDKIPALPERLNGLGALALNLAWSWHRQARALFRRIDESLWRLSHHNPITLLRQTTPERLESLSHDPDFCAHYDEVMDWFALESNSNAGWFRERYPDIAGDRPVAYFCAEFGLHASVPIYSGGLGILAGDHCKAASDLAVPLVGIGLLYKKGYFNQRITPAGWQEDSDDQVNPDATPLMHIPGPDGPWLTVLDTFARPVHIAVWTMTVGRAPLYFLDTDLAENHPDDRALTSKLYAGGAELRMRQEWILGTGGVRVLRALGIDPAAWHANEGHAAFMMLERLREAMVGGSSFEDAMHAVRATSIFTTHTPVPAGHDAFDAGQVAECAGASFLADFGDAAERAVMLGVRPGRESSRAFEMTVLAIRLAAHVNGVAQRHGAVSRQLWGDLWSERPLDAVPIGAITNGVHLATWMANPIMRLLDFHVGDDWGYRLDEEQLWDAVLGLDAREMWRTHQELKETLIRYLREEARRRWRSEWSEAAQVVAAGSLLDAEVFTIGFARRFATYKRANLLFHDIERLRRIVTDLNRPVQLIFAGKAHPQDNPGKEILQSIYHYTRDPLFEGRVAFLEDYDMHLAHVLVQGVDLWLNLPRIPLEASGTSGMKAALNGVPQLSTIDGWWEEAFNGKNGWAIPKAPGTMSTDEADAADAEALYRLLERDIVPLWYQQDARGVPRRWVQRMKESIRVAGRRFTARRMLQDYVTSYYAPILQGEPFTDDPPLS